MDRRFSAAVLAVALVLSLSSSAFALSYTDDCEKIQSNDAARYQGFLVAAPLLSLGWVGSGDPYALKVKEDNAIVTYKAGGAESVRVEILTDMPTYAINDPKDGYVFGKYPLGNVKDIIRCRYDKDYDAIFTYDADNDYVLQAENEIPKFGMMDRQHNIKSEFFGLNVAVSPGNSQFKECGEVTLTDIYATEDKLFYRETYMVKIPPGTVEIRLKLTFFNTLYGVDSPDIYALDKNMLLSRVVISGDRLYMGDEPPYEPSDPESTEPEPEPSKPESSKPESSGPESSRPESSKPESSRPESSKPESSKPESSRPESSKPESSKPESSKPESSKPESSNPEPSTPESSNPYPVPPVVPSEPPPRHTSAYGENGSDGASGAGLLKLYDTDGNGMELETPRTSQKLESNSAAHTPDAHPDGGSHESSGDGASAPIVDKASARGIGTSSTATGEGIGGIELFFGGGSVSVVAVSYIGISLLLGRRL